MSDSGFDTLNTFKTDLSIKPVSPVKPIQPIQGGSFSVADPEQDQINKTKDQLNAEQAGQAVDQTPYYNNLAIQYADQFLPVAQTRDQMDAMQSLIAQQMGLGKRVTFADALTSIEQQLGPLPKTSTVDKSINFLVDSINARTPYKGAAGVFDVLAQATGKYVNRETAEKAAQIEHSLKMKEMAIKQMQDQNAAILAKESEFLLKKMGQDSEYMMKNLSYDMELQKSLADFDLEIAKEKQKAALDLFKNPDRLFQNITFTDETGRAVVQMSKKVWNPEKGTYEFMLPRRDEATGDVVFDVEAPPGAYLSPLEGTQEDAALSVSAPNYGQASNLIGDFNTLGRAGDIVTEMLEIDRQAVEDGQPSKFGAEGLVDFFKKESKATFGSFMNAISPGLGDQLTQEGRTLREKDKVFYQLGEGEEPEAELVTLQAPKSGVKVPFLTEDFKPVQKLMTVDDYFRPITYTSIGYDESYARLKVQENLIIYALARALKPTGRLNVDDISRASQLVDLQGFKSPDYVRTQLGTILDFIRAAQVDLYEQGFYGPEGKKNIFDNPRYAEEVTRFKEFLGEVPLIKPDVPAVPKQEYDATDQDQGVDNEFVLEPEDLYGVSY
jgi:hypothetical protein